MTRAEVVARLQGIADQLKEIDRQLVKLCPFLDRASNLNTQRSELTRQARALTDEAPKA